MEICAVSRSSNRISPARKSGGGNIWSAWPSAGCIIGRGVTWKLKSSPTCVSISPRNRFYGLFDKFATIDLSPGPFSRLSAAITAKDYYTRRFLLRGGRKFYLGALS